MKNLPAYLTDVALEEWLSGNSQLEESFFCVLYISQSAISKMGMKVQKE
jgi:hypothetical protein